MTLPSAPDVPVAAAFRRRLAAVHVNHKRIAASALLIGALTAIAKLFVAGREIAIAWRYGVSATVDSYQLGLTIVTWLPMMMVSVMTVVLVPRLVGARDSSAEQRQFVDELNGTILVVGVALGIATWVAAPFGSWLLGSGADPGTIHLTTAMCRLMSPVACLVVWTGFLSARLQAQERFAYTVTEAVPALIIAAVVFLALGVGAAPRLGLATSAGYAVQALVLFEMLRRLRHGFGTFALRHRSPEWSSVYRNLGIMLLGQIVVTAVLPIDQAFAARIGAGSVATLGYANRIVVLVTGLGGVVFTRTFLPVFSSAIVEGQDKAASRQARQWAVLLMIAAAGALAVTWVVADWAVSIVFQRGAFSAGDAARVAHVLRFAMLQVPFVFGGLALVQLIAARGLYSSLLWIACGGLAIKLVLNFILVGRFGLAGLMIGTAAMYGFSFACQYVVGSTK